MSFSSHCQMTVSVFRSPSCQLSLLPSVRASEAELSAVDLAGDGALTECVADGLIQALQEFVDTLSITAHERGDHGAFIHRDGRAFDRCDPPEYRLKCPP